MKERVLSSMIICESIEMLHAQVDARTQQSTAVQQMPTMTALTEMRTEKETLHALVVAAGRAVNHHHHYHDYYYH